MPDSSDPGQTLGHSSTTRIPNLTDRIVRPDDQYCEAGGFGDVFRCQYTSDDGVKHVAVKAFRFNFAIDEHQCGGIEAARMIRRELGIWRRLSHRNVVPFLGIVYGFGRQGSASLVSLWMPHGTLHTFLETHDDKLIVAHRLQLLLDIANGLHYLHSLPMVHGDLSSNNVLLDHNYNACLTDFGYSSLVGELPKGFTYLKMTAVRPGTIRWAAPEHFSLDEEETKQTVKSDIYSFGNMALLVLSGEHPWSEVRVDAAVVLRLSQGYKPNRPLARPIDDRHWALIERCWSSILERPLAEDLVSSLQQHLSAYPPPPPLCGLLNVPKLPSSIPDCPSDVDSEDYRTPTESPIDTPRSSTPIGVSASASLPAPEDIAGYPDPRTSSLEPSLRERRDTKGKSKAKKSEEDIPSHHLVASRVPTYPSEEQTREVFQRPGELKRFRLVQKARHGPSKRIMFSNHVDASVTDVAVQGLSDMKLGGCQIIVQSGGTTPSGAEETCRNLERKKTGKKLTRDEDDSQKQPGYTRAGDSYDKPPGPTASSKHERSADSVAGRIDLPEIISQTRNVVFIGETGSGKSSITNLITNHADAVVSPDGMPCTHDFSFYEVSIDGRRYKLWDTPGLDEASGFTKLFGRPASITVSIQRFLQERRRLGELDLLVLCVPGHRAHEGMGRAYKIFCHPTRQIAIPVVIAITHLEMEQPTMETWWHRNEVAFAIQGLVFDGHVCITGLPFNHRRWASQREIRDLISRGSQQRPTPTLSDRD